MPRQEVRWWASAMRHRVLLGRFIPGSRLVSRDSCRAVTGSDCRWLRMARPVPQRVSVRRGGRRTSCPFRRRLHQRCLPDDGAPAAEAFFIRALEPEPGLSQPFERARTRLATPGSCAAPAAASMPVSSCGQPYRPCTTPVPLPGCSGRSRSCGPPAKRPGGGTPRPASAPHHRSPSVQSVREDGCHLPRGRTPESSSDSDQAGHLLPGIHIVGR